MLYVQQSLGPDEELIHIGKFHWMYTVGAFMSIFWGLVMAIIVMVAAYNIYVFMGDINPSTGFFDSIKKINPLARAFSFLMFIMGL